MSMATELEQVFDKRRNYICFGCNHIYFMADLEKIIPEEEWPDNDENFNDIVDLSKDDNHYMFLEPCNRDFHYMEAENLVYGLAEYLNRDSIGFDKNEVPCISYETTKDNKIIFTCFVDKELDLKSKPNCERSDYKNLNIIERLKEYIDGQISDGWGENGLFLYHFMGCPTIIAYPNNLRRVEKDFKKFSLDWEWKEVK